MFRLTLKRTVLDALLTVLVLFFFALLAYAFFSYSWQFTALDVAYYVVTCVVMFAIYFSLMSFTSSSYFRDAHHYLIIALLFLICYAIVDLFVRLLYSLLPFEDPLSALITARLFFSIASVGCFALEQYKELFHSKANAEAVNVVLFVVSLILSLSVRPTFNTNIHIFIILVSLVVAVFFHTVIYTLSNTELTVLGKISAISFDVLSITGALIYTLFANEVISLVGLSILLFSLILFFFNTKKD